MRTATESLETQPAQRRWLASLWRRSPRAMGWAFMAPILAGLVFVGQAYWLARVLDEIIRRGQPVHSLGWGIAIIVALLLLRAVLLWSGQRSASRAAEHIKRELRTELFAALLQRGPAWTRQTPSGSLAAVLIEQVEALDGYLRNFLPAMYAAGLLPLIFTLAVLPTDWIVALLFIVTAPLIPVFMALVGWGAEAVNKRHQEVLRQLSGMFGDRIRGIFTLTLLGRSQAEVQAVKEANDRLNQATMSVLRIAFISSAVLELFAALGVAGVAVYIGFSYLGSFGPAFSDYSLQHGLFCLIIAPEVYNPLRQLAAGYHERATAQAATEQIEALLHAQSPSPAKTAARVQWQSAAQRPQPGLLLQVSAGVLRTPDARQLILEDLCLSIHQGDQIALTGPSGAGKTSLLETLMGLRVPAGGTWSFYGLGTARQGAALLIGQHPFLMLGTVRELLCLAAPQAGDEDLWQALEQARAADFVRRLPQGLNTTLGTRGHGVSGGQAHRLALARLFLADPPLLMVDEPTAHLDPQTRDEVMDNLLTFGEQRALIVATHDQEVAQRLGRQWVIEEHSIREQA